MSGYVNDDLASQATALGIAAFLDKPIDMAEYGRLVHRAAQRVAPMPSGLAIATLDTSAPDTAQPRSSGGAAAAHTAPMSATSRLTES
jgi:hypothetical protein